MEEQNYLQLIKVLKAELSIRTRTDDDANNRIFSDFFKEIQALASQAKGDDRFIICVLINNFVLDYHDNNERKIISRINMNQNHTDMESWTSADFRNLLQKTIRNLRSKKRYFKA